MSMHGVLLTASCSAAMRPAGPAPTTSTGVEWWVSSWVCGSWLVVRMVGNVLDN
jgi:hypothetical protein